MNTALVVTRSTNVMELLDDTVQPVVAAEPPATHLKEIELSPMVPFKELRGQTRVFMTLEVGWLQGTVSHPIGETVEQMMLNRIQRSDFASRLFRAPGQAE